MILAALRFRNAELWKTLDDSMIFAVRLPGGETGYCCVMGNAGSHYSLGLYRGDHGFSSYLSTIYIKPTSRLEQFERFQTLMCINCDFENSADSSLSKEDKEHVRAVAAANKLKIRRPNGWPDIMTIDRGSQMSGVPTEADAADLVAALNAAVAVADELAEKSGSLFSLGFSPYQGYAPAEGGMEIPLVVPMDHGQYEFTTTKTPPYMGSQILVLTYTNEQVIAAIRRIPHKGVFQARLVHSQTPVGKRGSLYYPPMFFMINAKAMTFLPPFMGEGKMEDAVPTILQQLVNMFSESVYVPKTIEVADDATEGMIADFCKKCDIKIARVNRTDAVNEMIEDLFAWMR